MLVRPYCVQCKCSNLALQDIEGSNKICTNPASRAGLISHILARLKREVERGQIKPVLVMGIIPACNAQFERLFGTTRVPGAVSDRLLHYPGSQSEYCVCCHKGKWFKVPLTSPQGRIYSPAEMEWQFVKVREEGSGEEVKPGEESLPALTALGRNEWAEARSMYFEEGINKVAMETIEKVSSVIYYLSIDYSVQVVFLQAAFVLMYDDKTPAMSSEVCSELDK